ncbi:MAG TPA: hypothetical protein VFV39_12300 [Limnobacter sp.]|nr:hypothetical protein [Limnobacter sp.]
MSQRFDALQAKKELLQMKAQLERMQFGSELEDLRHEFAWLQVFKKVGTWLNQRNLSALGPWASLGGQLWQGWFKQYPLLGLVASSALVRYRQPLAKATFRAGAAAVVLAAAMYWFKTRGSGGRASSLTSQGGPSTP